MQATKPIAMGVRLEAYLGDAFKEICDQKHIAPSTMIRVLIHRFVEECGYQPDPLAVVDALAKENQKRKPGVKRK